MIHPPSVGPITGATTMPDAVHRHRRAVLARRKALQQDGLRQRLHAAAADALQHAGHDQHGHADGDPAQQGCAVNTRIESISSRLRPMRRVIQPSRAA